jgi:hypothetical protein
MAHQAPAIPPAAPRLAGGPPAPTIFALGPALIHNQALDYLTSKGSKAYKAAIAPLFTDAELFNCEATDLFTFIGTIDDRADQNEWHDSILSVLVDITQPMGDAANMIASYGTVTLEHIQAHALTYVTTQTRAAQDSIQLYLCIMNSLTKAGKSKVKV